MLSKYQALAQVHGARDSLHFYLQVPMPPPTPLRRGPSHDRSKAVGGATKQKQECVAGWGGGDSGRLQFHGPPAHDRGLVPALPTTSCEIADRPCSEL